MGIFDGIGQGFSAVINGVEHVAGDMGSLVEHAVSELEGIGIAAVGDIRWLVQFLIEQGEDPILVLARLSTHISSIGGEVTSTLEQMANGIMISGVTAFLKMKVELALQPMQETLRQSSTSGQMVADVHRTTLTTMQAKLNVLKTGNNTSGAAWQGQSVEAMSATFADISSVINQLSDQIQHDGTQARLNQAFITVLEGIGIIAAALALLDILLIIASAVVVAGTAGVGAVVVVPIDAGVLAAELTLLLELVAGDCLLWLLGTLAIYVAHHPIIHTTTTQAVPAQPIIHQLALPKEPNLTPSQTEAANELLREFGLAGNEAALKWIKLLLQALGTGMSIEDAKAVIRCLRAKGYLDGFVSSTWNSVADHLTPRDIQGAWKDNNGMDSSADHGGEVNDALTNLNNRIQQIDDILKDRTLSPAKRAFYKAIKLACQNTITYVKRLIKLGKQQGPSTDNWPEPKGRVPFAEDIIHASGCRP